RAMQGGGRRGGGGPGGGPGGFPGFPGAAGGSTDESDGARTAKIQASSDQRTNTVVVSGPAETLKVIDEMLDQLDANPLSEQSFFIYRVKNGQAIDMQNTLNSLFGGATTSTNTNRSSYNSATGNRVSGTGTNRGTGSRSGNTGF